MIDNLFSFEDDSRRRAALVRAAVALVRRTLERGAITGEDAFAVVEVPPAELGPPYARAKFTGEVMLDLLLAEIVEHAGHRPSTFQGRDGPHRLTAWQLRDPAAVRRWLAGHAGTTNEST